MIPRELEREIFEYTGYKLINGIYLREINKSQ